MAGSSPLPWPFEHALTQSPHYVLRLYVAGATPRSAHAIATVKAICQEYVPEQYELEVIDIYQQPGIAHDEQIVAVPALVRVKPLPVRTFIGDVSDVERLVAGLSFRRPG